MNWANILVKNQPVYWIEYYPPINFFALFSYIASKEKLIFHVGYRRFATCPVFSAHTNGRKHKYERFWRSQETVVMSMFAPITYPPANVLVSQNFNLEMEYQFHE